MPLRIGFSKEIYRGKTDYMFVFENEEQVKNIVANFQLISTLQCRGVIVTAKGNEVDFVSRFFAPQSGIDEDPVTGSAHTTLAPFWSKRLAKEELTAIQLSKRTGRLICRCVKDRVLITGKAITYMRGDISI